MRVITCIAFCLITLVAIFPIQIYQHDAFAKIDPESIIGIWLLDEGKGDKVEDRSGNGNDGLVVKAKWTDGKLGKGLEFDGTGHVAIPASKTTDDYLDGFTYLLWVKPTAAPPNPHTRLIERDWHNPTIQIGAADFYGSIAVNADQGATHIRGGTWKQDEWSFVALTYDGDIIKLYVDGEPVADKKVGKADDKPDGEIWLASWKNPGWSFRGFIDEVGVFNAPLTDDNIKHVMNNGLEKALAVSPTGKLASIWAHVKNIR